jgi:hypothetical protein
MSAPLVKGGQGRSGRELVDTLAVVSLDAVLVAFLLAALAVWLARGDA